MALHGNHKLVTPNWRWKKKSLKLNDGNLFVKLNFGILNTLNKKTFYNKVLTKLNIYSILSYK